MPRIIRTMQLFNYSPNPRGVCYGISMMAAQASLRQSNEVFANRIKFIHSCTEAEIETLKNSEKDDKEFAKKLDLLCFFDGISMYQGVDSVNSDFKSIAPKSQSLRKTRKIIESKTFKNDDQFVYPKIKSTLINVYTREEFLHFIGAVKQYFDQRPFSIKIRHSPVSHATQIGFDGKKWLSTDHDLAVLGEDNFEDLQKVVDNIFLLERHHSTERMVVLIDIFQPTSRYFDLKSLMPLRVQKISPQKPIKSFSKDVISHLLACYVSLYQYENYLNTLHKVSSLTLTENEKRELVESKRTNDITALHCAALSGEESIVNRILKIMDELGLSFETKISIINEKDNQGSTILYDTAQLGKTNIVKLLLNLSSAIKDQTLKADFLNAGKSALFIAAKNDHVSVVRQLIKAISTIEDKITQNALLLTKIDEGMTALFIAAQKGHAKVVCELIDAILSIENQAVKIEGLAAKDNDGNSALLIAVKKSHKGVIKALVRGIASIENKKARMELLTATDKEGKSVLSIAEQLGNKDIIKLLHTALEK